MKVKLLDVRLVIRVQLKTSGASELSEAPTVGRVPSSVVKSPASDKVLATKISGPVFASITYACLFNHISFESSWTRISGWYSEPLLLTWLADVQPVMHHLISTKGETSGCDITIKRTRQTGVREGWSKVANHCK